MHVYFGWICQTPGCGEEIPFKYLGEEPVKHNRTVKIPTVVLVKCRKCGQIHDYTRVRPQNLKYATPIPGFRGPM